MKLDALRKVIREEVKAAIQEELKDILLEAVRSPKQVVRETVAPAPVAAPAIPQKTREEIRESYKNILGDTAATFNSSQVQQPLRVTSTDTMSANGKLPDGDVSMDQIMGLMNK